MFDEPADKDVSPSNHLAELQAKQAALIKKGQDLMRELDRVTAEITKHQANCDSATKHSNAGNEGQQDSSA